MWDIMPGEKLLILYLSKLFSGLKENSGFNKAY